mmetsp:Transcript_38492/g.106072  ORF Transcript_38492/g.106072 Transcript_38492/m.106072 type:complete len:415 (+) Transcript_38492:34-1278(+)
MQWRTLQGFVGATFDWRGGTDRALIASSDTGAARVSEKKLASCTRPRRLLGFRERHHQSRSAFAADSRRAAGIGCVCLILDASVASVVASPTPTEQGTDEGMTFWSCSEHLRHHDWNENVTNEEFRAGYMITAYCGKNAMRLAREAGGARPSAQSGVHVPTVIVPTVSEQLPQLPPFYFVLPVWDMVVSNRIKLSGSYDVQELDVLLRLTSPGDTFVDVGANLGGVAVPLASHVGREGAVYAFEPFRQVFQYLNANVATNGLANVYTFQCALSDVDKPQRLSVPAPTLEAAQNVGMYAVFKAETSVPNERASQTRERMETVDVRTLDSFELPRVDVMKIDVEGHAAQVLRGSVETLRAHRPILWFEDGSLQPPEVLMDPELRYWCTRFDTAVTQEEQFLCYPRERHDELQQRVI